MVNWKNFKNWLEKEVIISDGLKVKIRPEKQVIYGELSEIVLTNFCDSLEATLDQNGSYHLFPDFAKYQDFDELFNGRVIFGKKTNQREIKNNDYDLLKKIFGDWKEQEKVKEWEEFSKELTLMVCPEKLFDGESYSYRELLLEKVGELAKRNAERENKLNGQPPGKEKQDEKSAQRAVEEKNNEILQLKRRLELLEESRAEMVSAREGEIEELEKKLKNKNEEVKWLQGQLKNALGEEQYNSQIVVNYPPQWKK